MTATEAGTAHHLGRARAGVRLRASKFALSLLEPRRLLLAFFSLNLLPFAVVVVARALTQPLALSAFTDFRGWNMFHSYGAVSILMAGNVGLWLMVLSAMVERELEDRQRVLLGVNSLIGIALGATFGIGGLRLAQPWFFEHFVERTQPMVAALDAYVADHDAPPPELGSLVPDYIDRLPFGLGMLELEERDAGWAFELRLNEYPVGKSEVLALRPAAERGKRPGMKCYFWKSYGPWDHWMGF